MKKKTLSGLVAVLFVFGGLCLAQPEDVQDLGPKIFQAQWVSVDKLPPDTSSIIPSPWGNDPLRDGEIEVRAKGQVKVDLEGVEPDSEYTLWVCKFTSAALDQRCTQLGKVPSDSKGKAGAVVPWPSAAFGPYAVFFVLTRNATAMFVSGFHMPSGVPPVTGVPPSPGGPPADPPKPGWKEVQLKGTIASVGSGSFMVGDVMVQVDGATEFTGRVKQFSDLTVGMSVQVMGKTVTGGVLAVRVIVTGKP